jgi:hypothetical protein
VKAAAQGCMVVSPTTNLCTYGNAGGPFSPAWISYSLTNTGGVAVSWTASKSQSWLTLSSTSGTLAGGATTTVTVSLNSLANALAAGTYTDTVTFANSTNGAGNTNRLVTLAVTAIPAGSISVSLTTGFSPIGNAGGPFYPASATYYVYNNGGAPLDWTVSKVQPWLTLSAANGTLAAYGYTSVTVSLNAAANSLAAGTFTDTLTFMNATNGKGGTTRPVTLTARAVALGALSLSSASGFYPVGNAGGPFGPSYMVYYLYNTGGAPINWTASRTRNWLTLSSSSGTIAARGYTYVIVSVNSAANTLAAGTYADALTFTNATNGQGSTTRPVTLTARAVIAAPVICPTAGLVSWGRVGGPFYPAVTTLYLVNSTSASMTWKASVPPAWMTLSSTGGTIPARGYVLVTATVNASANALTAATYTGMLTFTNTAPGGLGASRPLTLTVLPKQ